MEAVLQLLDPEGELLRLGLPERLILAGLDYVLEGRVQDAVILEGRLAARVVGHRGDYRVLAVPARPEEGRCDCGGAPPCRHGAAVWVAWVRGEGSFLHLDEAVQDPGQAPLARALFAMAAGLPSPLAALVVSAAPQSPHRAVDLSPERIAPLAPPAAADLARHHLGPDRPLPATPESREALRQAVNRASRGGVPLDGAAASRLVERFVAGTGGVRLDRALARWLARRTTAQGRALLWARVEAAAWQAEAERLAHPAGWDRARAERAAGLLFDLAEARGTSALLDLAARHPHLPRVGLRLARRFLTLGRPTQALRVAREAFLATPSPAEREALRRLIVRLGRQGLGGARAFLLAVWEADPDRDGLLALRTMGSAAQQAEFAAAARRILSARRRDDLLAALCLAEGDRSGAAQYALREGPHPVPASEAMALAQALAEEEPLVAVRLLGAAFRRSATPPQRRQAVRLARRLAERHGLGDWAQMRRRWFPERPAGSAPR